MKYLNYFIGLVVVWIAAAWLFNHVSAIAGALVVVGTLYFLIGKFFKFIKDNRNVK